MGNNVMPLPINWMIKNDTFVELWWLQFDQKDSLAGSRTPLSRGQRIVTGACTNPIYYQGLSAQQKSRYLYEKFPLVKRSTNSLGRRHSSSRATLSTPFESRMPALYLSRLVPPPVSLHLALHRSSLLWVPRIYVLASLFTPSLIQMVRTRVWMAYLLLLDLGCSPLAVTDH